MRRTNFRADIKNGKWKKEERKGWREEGRKKKKKINICNIIFKLEI